LHPDKRQTLEGRVVRAAEEALSRQQYVTPIDVFLGIGWLARPHVDAWRKGRIDSLEEMIRGNLKKISLAARVFRQWAEAKGLRASETRYVRHTRGGLIDLQFSKSGAPAIEKAYRTHYVSPELRERKQQKLEERLGHAPQPVVFAILRESRCSECGTELAQGDFLYMEAGQPLCLACANMGDLEYLPAGDTALTRRAGKDSVRSAVVVRFSRSRGRYERQGILVEPSALEKAERECTEDAEARARQRSRAASQRAEQDRELVGAHDGADPVLVSRLSRERGARHRSAHRRARQRPGGPDRGRPQPGRAGAVGRRGRRGTSSAHEV
jgi:hypothetical protein